MPVTVDILAEHNLIHTTMDGVVLVRDHRAGAAALASHPLRKPGQNALVDLSRVTSYERSLGKLLAFQPEKAEIIAKTGHVMRIAYYAPSPHNQDLAEALIRSWGRNPNVVTLLATNERQALEFLDLPQASISALLIET